MSTAGWASAARRVLGEAWIAGPSGIVAPEVLRSHGSNPALTAAGAPRWRRALHPAVKTAIKDLRQWRRARSFRIEATGPWFGSDLAFVWQRHDLFHDAGLVLADELRVPSVLFVPATLVWEAAEWGVERPGWKRALERVAESPALRRADVVACGSDDVVAQVRRLGVRPERVIVTPTGVDLELFTPDDRLQALRDELGLSGRFVAGWVGSFRRFHALELAVDAAAETEGCTLLLIGDGPERERIERYCRERGVDAVFTGTVPHEDLPAYLGAMDVGLVVAAGDAAFHYSPLKLAEYLAAGVAAIVPRVAQLEGRLEHGRDAVVVPRGDHRALADAMCRLRDDPEERARIARAGRMAAVDRWSWDHAVRQVVAALSRSSR